MECQTILSIRQLSTEMRRRIDSSQIKQELDHLTGMNGWILGYLAEHENEDIYQRDLEKDLGICRSGVSKIVAALEQNGLLTRSRVASDDRLKKLVLTDLGRKYTGLIREDNRRMEAQLTRGFTPEELKALQDYLVRMRWNITAEA